jgi:hypothetical protein
MTAFRAFLSGPLSVDCTQLTSLLEVAACLSPVLAGVIT